VDDRPIIQEHGVVVMEPDVDTQSPHMSRLGRVTFGGGPAIRNQELRITP
jgi:hypothetical protein